MRSTRKKVWIASQDPSGVRTHTYSSSTCIHVHVHMWGPDTHWSGWTSDGLKKGSWKGIRRTEALFRNLKHIFLHYTNINNSYSGIFHFFSLPFFLSRFIRTSRLIQDIITISTKWENDVWRVIRCICMRERRKGLCNEYWGISPAANCTMTNQLLSQALAFGFGLGVHCVIARDVCRIELGPSRNISLMRW